MAAAIAVTCVVATEAVAAPNIQSALIKTRIFNDDPSSTILTTNNYPTLISIDETLGTAPTGTFANRHNFRLSSDPFPAAAAASFQNGDKFSFAADLTISGTGNGEAGIGISPWYSPDVDGVFNFRTTDGEIACFGGRLPFYNFTASQGLHYVKGTTVRAGFNYDPHSLTAADPATIEYTLTIGGTDYSSGILQFNEGNPAEDPPHGLWGILDPSFVGGNMQHFLSGGPGSTFVTTWENISYTPEPASLALLGLGALTVVRRRRR
ncbi:MAG TPA: PEP-CTERM sorting domain-containing protein [Phycisphaerae bacterium]|nr:PEP-CTERM sorting domain-containing protein [Phycisphaerae bacterium]